MFEYKGYTIYYEGRFPKFLIKVKGKGSLPKVLQSGYRSKHTAQQAIDTYLASKPQSKEPSNGTTEGTTGS